MSGKRPFPIRLIRALWLIARDRNYRNLAWLRIVRPRGVFQSYNDTGADRYPAIFRFVQSQLGADRDRRILSFGCSTGEEVFSLRHYFPRAVIKGIDINPLNIAACRKRLVRAPAAGIAFETAATTAREPAGVYDAIFCMSVLQHGQLAEPGTTRCDHLIRFEDFAAVARDFGRALKPGCLLVIRHSNFRLADAPAGADFDTVFAVAPPRPERLPLFGPDNRLLSGTVYPDAVFRKKVA